MPPACVLYYPVHHISVKQIGLGQFKELGKAKEVPYFNYGAVQDCSISLVLSYTHDRHSFQNADFQGGKYDYGQSANLLLQ